MPDRINTRAFSYQACVQSGELGKAQAMYLHVFITAFNLNQSLTHLEATELVEAAFSRKMPARNGRIAELEERGFLKKDGTTFCKKTKRLVNRWTWTGRTTPFEAKTEWVECDCCKGKGGFLKKVYRAPAETTPSDLFLK